MLTFAERMRILINEKTGGNSSAFAKKAGIPPATLHNYLSGRLPQAEQLINIREAYNVNLNWLLTGEGDPFFDDLVIREEQKPLNAEQQCLSPRDFVTLPMLESRVVAGPAGELLYEEVKDYYPFKRWWVERSFGKTEERLKSLVLLKVRGDSMSPTIDPGEIILVDTHEQERIEIRTGQIYLITMPDGASAIKRLALSEQAGRMKLICMSDNIAVYRPFEFELDPGKSIKHYVLGRVRWAGKEFD